MQKLWSEICYFIHCRNSKPASAWDLNYFPYTRFPKGCIQIMFLYSLLCRFYSYFALLLFSNLIPGSFFNDYVAFAEIKFVLLFLRHISYLIYVELGKEMPLVG